MCSIAPHVLKIVMPLTWISYLQPVFDLSRLGFGNVSVIGARLKTNQCQLPIATLDAILYVKVYAIHIYLRMYFESGESLALIVRFIKDADKLLNVYTCYLAIQK